MGTSDGPGPTDLRRAVAEYVHQLHGSYLAQARTFPPGVRGRMPLLAPGALTVVAVGVRNLHLVATREALGPLQGQEVSLDDELGGLSWQLRFYDPVVLPALALVDERSGPAFDEVRHLLGVGTVVYHVVAQPGAGLSGHHAVHAGTGLAGAHSAVARDFETIRERVRGREALVDEMAGAASAGLRRAHALLARAVAPRDEVLAALAEEADPEPDAVRRALLASVGGRTQWTPPEPGHAAAAGGAR